MEGEGGNISPLLQGSSPGWGLECQQPSFLQAGKSIQRRLGAGQSWLLAPGRLLFRTVLLQVLLVRLHHGGLGPLLTGVQAVGIRGDGRRGGDA